MTGAGRQGLVRWPAEVIGGSLLEGSAGPGGELWFVIAGTGSLTSGTRPAVAVRADTGAWLRPGTRYRLSADSPAPLRLDRVLLPAGLLPAGLLPAGSLPAGPPPAGAGAPDDDAAALVAELADSAVQVTGDRRFRILFGPGAGCSAVTQFVGEIPPGAAPPHRHAYDELVLILDGEGVLHAGCDDHPVAPGSSIHLPPGMPHCLENTGRTIMRVLGVFHPGGSPAAKQDRPGGIQRS